MSGASELVRGAWVMTMAPGQEPIPDGAVAISGDGEILATGAFSAVHAAHPGARVSGDGTGVVMPGLINGHTHLSESLIPGLAEDTRLWEWFERAVGPSAAELTRADMMIGTRLRAAEMLCSGVTTVNDMTCHRNVGSLASLGAVDGLSAMGMRGFVSFGAEDDYPGAPPPLDFMHEHEALADRLADEPLLAFRVGVGTILGVTDELMARTVESCREHDWGVHTHLAEVIDEVSESRRRWRRSSIGHAADVGLLDHHVVAGHCIWCDAPDVALLASTHVSAIHNPVSNMLLGSGVCPVEWLRAEGIPVGLGTDGAASNDNQDMFFVLKCTPLLHKISAHDPRRMSARDALEMATIEGARALELDGLIGSLEPGKRADIVLLAGDTPEMATVHDPIPHVVYSATARSVDAVWVDGVQRVADGSPVGVDLAELTHLARAQAADLAMRARMDVPAKPPQRDGASDS